MMARMGRLVLLFMISLGVTVAIVFALKIIREDQGIETIRMATGSATGEYYAFADAIAQVTESHEPRIKVNVLETAGSTQNMLDVQSHAVDMALVQSNTPVLPAVRAVAQLYPEIFHLIANKAANIETMADLRGKRIALMTKGSGSYDLFWPLSLHYGLNPGDFEAFPLPPDQAHQALQQGKVDALFRIIGTGNGAVSALLKTGQFELVPIEQIGALRLTQPYLQSTVIPKGTYAGGLPIPPEDMATVSVSALLVAHKDVSPEVVTAITRVLYERRNELIAINPRTANIQSPDTNQNLGFPLHAGARAYYNQDQPSFFVEYADLIGLSLSASVLLFSGLWQFRLWLIGNQKNRADLYNLEILGLIEEIEQAQTLEELQEIRQKLFSIFKAVVTDFDVDRISSESFRSFAFPWEVAIATIRHQEILLVKSPDKD